MLAHSEKEESSEFAGFREQTRPAERRAMTAAAKVAVALAPTYPHPGVETAGSNLLVGTPLAMIDPARDLIRDALGLKGGPSAPNGNGGTPAASGTGNKEIVRRLTEAFDAADEPAIRYLLATDFLAHGMPPESKKVTSRFAARGTHTGELFGVPSSNRTLTVTGIEI